jgi:membrane protease YdiL (CAAX protease family)
MPGPGKLGWWSAIAAYVALLFGMQVIAIPAQLHGIVTGLWVTEAFAIALPAMFVLTFAGIRPAPYLGFRPLSWEQALIAVGVTVANQPVVSFLTWVAHGVLPRAMVEAFDDYQRSLDTFFRAQAVPMLVTVIVAAPLAEEVFFRGCALPALSRSMRPILAILISSAMFAFLHGSAVGFVGLMEIGVLLAALRWWSGSLWASIIAHAVNNGVAGGAFLLGWEDPNVPPPPWVLASGATLLIVGIGLLRRVLRDKPDIDAEEVPSGPRRSVTMVLALMWTGAVIWGARLVLRLRGLI